MLTSQLDYDSMLSSLPAPAANAVAHRSQRGKPAKSIPLLKYTNGNTFEKPQTRTKQTNKSQPNLIQLHVRIYRFDTDQFEVIFT